MQIISACAVLEIKMQLCKPAATKFHCQLSWEPLLPDGCVIITSQITESWYCPTRGGEKKKKHNNGYAVFLNQGPTVKSLLHSLCTLMWHLVTFYLIHRKWESRSALPMHGLALLSWRVYGWVHFVSVETKSYQQAKNPKTESWVQSIPNFWYFTSL